eukprot:INCI19062.1.p1 GENE.INCI19062.1~~INCI19062.1.p1  ORF type:complete len:489 (-),score=113.32 INCI19062.1:498-1811(-)
MASLFASRCRGGSLVTSLAAASLRRRGALSRCSNAAAASFLRLRSTAAATVDLGSELGSEVFDDEHEGLREELRERGLDKLTVTVARKDGSPEGIRQRLDEREQLLVDKLTRNLPPQFEKIKGSVPERETVSNRGTLQVRGRERELYELHLSDPQQWNPKTLGKKYAISQVRAQAIIMLERLHDERLARGDLDVDPDVALDLATVSLDMTAFGGSASSDSSEVDQAAAEGGDAASAEDESVSVVADASADDVDAEGSDGADDDAGEEEEAEQLSARQRWVAARKALVVAAAADKQVEISQAELQFFDEHGFFQSELRDIPRTRVDRGDGRGALRFELDDFETVRDAIELANKKAAVERPVHPPKPTVLAPHEVAQKLNLDDSPDARFRRKLVIEDISVGKKVRDVKVLDHDGSLRSAEDDELRHRHQLNRGRRRKKR